MWPPTVVAKEKKRTTLGAPKLNFDLPKRTSRSSCGRPAPRDTRLIKQSAFSTLSPELCCALHGKLGKFSTKQASRQKEGKKKATFRKRKRKFKMMLLFYLIANEDVISLLVCGGCVERFLLFPPQRRPLNRERPPH